MGWTRAEQGVAMGQATGARAEPETPQAARARDPVGREQEAGPSRRDPNRQLVLVIEDEAHDWEIYGKILWYNGFDVLYTPDGAEGLHLAEDHHPDLVLLDLGLPGMDGLELCRRLKQGPAGSEIPVVVLTARSERKHGEEARRAGCDRYLEKPQSPLQVLNEVESVIGQAPPGGDGPPPDVERPG